MGFDYGTSVTEAKLIEEEILTGRGHSISDVYVEKKIGESVEEGKEGIEEEDGGSDKVSFHIDWCCRNQQNTFEWQELASIFNFCSHGYRTTIQMKMTIGVRTGSGMRPSTMT